jgi:tetratricopeptide (TPR) repeat protein
LFSGAGEGKPWSLSDLDPIRARFAGAPSGDRAIFLAQTGAKLVAARELEAGKQLLDEALRLDDRLPDAWAGLATYHTARGDWRDALNEVNRALSLDGDFLPALSTKTLLLYGSKQYSAAYELSSKLVSEFPDDPNILFYHAKIAHEARAYKSEIEALLKLIALAEAENRPVSGYQIYLGQAYAKVGEASRSIDQFMLALDDPDLSEDQRSLVMDNIVRIKKKGAVETGKRRPETGTGGGRRPESGLEALRQVYGATETAEALVQDSLWRNGDQPETGKGNSMMSV